MTIFAAPMAAACPLAGPTLGAGWPVPGARGLDGVIWPGVPGSTNYSRVAFEANLPRIETNTCNRSTSAGCTLIPTTDKGTPAAFYPFFSAFQNGVPGVPGGGRCMWGFGNTLPGSTTDFGRNAQYGSLLSSTYLVFGGHGATTHLINNFRQILPNPCTAGGRPG